MQLKILAPSETVAHEEATKITGEAANGSFTLLPRHVDFVTALVPGILIYADTDGVEHFVAVNHGVLVKKGNEVLVSCANAFSGPDLRSLRDIVTGMEDVSEEHDRASRSALAKLEVNIVRRFLELER